MTLRIVTRGNGGSEKQEVKIEDIAVFDIRSLSLFTPYKRWASAIMRYHTDLNCLLQAAKSQQALPNEFFVPDLWEPSLHLPKEEREMLIDMWHLGHDLAESVGYQMGFPFDYVRNKVGGVVYVLWPDNSVLKGASNGA